MYFERLYVLQAPRLPHSAAYSRQCLSTTVLDGLGSKFSAGSVRHLRGTFAWVLPDFEVRIEPSSHNSGGPISSGTSHL